MNVSIFDYNIKKILTDFFTLRLKYKTIKLLLKYRKIIESILQNDKRIKLSLLRKIKADELRVCIKFHNTYCLRPELHINADQFRDKINHVIKNVINDINPLSMKR
jgi:hypothetical protein